MVGETENASHTEKLTLPNSPNVRKSDVDGAYLLRPVPTRRRRSNGLSQTLYDPDPYSVGLLLNRRKRAADARFPSPQTEARGYVEFPNFMSNVLANPSHEPGVTVQKGDEGVDVEQVFHSRKFGAGWSR
jgi:hypothetical protein